MSSPPEQTDFFPTLAAVHRSLVATMMARLADRGYTDMTHAFASLMPLLDASGIRATVLAQRSGITKQAVSQLVRELKERGYVEQVSDPTDTRAKIVRLTTRGIALKATCAGIRKELTAAATKALGKATMARLLHDLGELGAVLTQTIPPKS